MDRTLVEYFRCPDHIAQFEMSGELSTAPGFFKFGGNTICYGRCAAGSPAEHFMQDLLDASDRVEMQGERLRLPFDLSHVIDNLRHERYYVNSQRSFERITSGAASRKIYYFLRPILPVPMRKHLQKARLRGWDRIMFPRWPVDCTVETLMQTAMALALKARRIQEVPFIWFWP
ncbi:MAG TPA: hypothetical protein VJ180_09935, partial [Pyrinomonadaceae bacterium]|nr:hypothetical protein [Pyrinomonadaceae bacterium]